MNPFKETDVPTTAFSEERNEQADKNEIRNENDVSEMMSYTDIARRQQLQNVVSDKTNPTTKTAVRQLARRSSSTAVDIYNEIKSKREEELSIIIEDQRQTIENLQNEVKQLKSAMNADDRSTKKRKREECVSTDGDEDCEKVNMQQKIDELTEKLKQQNGELFEVRELLSETEHTAPLNEEEILTSQASDTTNVSSFFQNIKKTMEKKLIEIQETIKTTIDERLDKKDQERIANENIPSTSYAEALTNNTEETISKIRHNATSLRDVMMNTKNEELAEEREKKARCCNIMIHGKEFVTENDDKEFVNHLFKTLAIGNKKFKAIQRIGKSLNTENSKKPIKIEMINEQDRDAVLSNLRNLKNDSGFNGIGITEDYTISERQLIKGYNEKAKKMNEFESDKDNFVWRVRGCPKNGLFLKKVKKVNNVRSQNAASVTQNMEH